MKAEITFDDVDWEPTARLVLLIKPESRTEAMVAKRFAKLIGWRFDDLMGPYGEMRCLGPEAA